MSENDSPLAITSAHQLRAALGRRFPEIRPYGEDDWDWTWADEGMDYLDAGDYAMAELKFQQVVVSQPDHCDGYEGLALLYQRIGSRREALILIDEAVRIARLHVNRGWMDPEVLEEIAAERESILGMPTEPERGLRPASDDPEP